MVNRKEQIHFIGIGGAGMFPMAEVLHRQGYKITGSDANKSTATTVLSNWGVDVQIGHKAELVKKADIVVYSSAVKESNEEMIVARKMGKIVMKRAVMLGDLMRKSFSIAIAGTHGKTTTTSIVAKILEVSHKDPTVIVGGVFKGDNRNSGALVGNGEVMVVEADEYDRSFLQMYPSVAIITNIEEDHLDIYKDLDDIKDAFSQFIHRVPFYGESIICIDDKGACEVASKTDKPVVTYGFDKNADFRITDYVAQRGESKFSVIARGEQLGQFSIKLTGKHNIQNATAAITIAVDMGIDLSEIKKALAKFLGVKRRMDILGVENSITVIDDYAHHPTEVSATLNAIKESGYSRTTVIFQPHLYSRTKEFYKEFASALSIADRVILLPIFRAREEPVDGISSKLILDEIKGKDAQVFENSSEIISYLSNSKIADEVILLMGAGDVWKMGDKILGAIK